MRGNAKMAVKSIAFIWMINLDGNSMTEPIDEGG